MNTGGLGMTSGVRTSGVGDTAHDIDRSLHGNLERSAGHSLAEHGEWPLQTRISGRPNVEVPTYA